MHKSVFYLIILDSELQNTTGHNLVANVSLVIRSRLSLMERFHVNKSYNDIRSGPCVNAYEKDMYVQES